MIFKGKKVFIICAGSSIVKYREAILNYLAINEFITIGCKVIGDFICPDYHCWFDWRGFRRDARVFNKKEIPLIKEGSIPIFVEGDCKENIIRKYWDGPYKTIKCKLCSWRSQKSFPRYTNGAFRGAFITTGCLSVFWSHIEGAKQIDIVGMDGYSFYSTKDLANGKESQHCFGDGFTEVKKREKLYRRKNIDINFEKGKERAQRKFKTKDNNILKTLTVLKDKYKVNFRILTPTCYNPFYVKGILKGD